MVEIYRSCHHNIERNLHITGLTQRHGPPNFSKTFETLASYFKIHTPNTLSCGRTTTHSVSDKLDDGLNNIEEAVDAQDEVEGQIEAEDLEVELL